MGGWDSREGRGSCCWWLGEEQEEQEEGDVGEPCDTQSVRERGHASFRRF